MEGNANECGICLGEWTNPVKLPCGHSFCANCLSGWKSNYAHDRLCRAKEQQGKRCPLCRGTIPPSQEEVANYKMIKSIVEDKSNIHDYDYETYVREVKLFEAGYGDDWEGNVIEYSNDFVSLPLYVAEAACKGDLRTVLKWLGKGIIKERVNAKCEEGGNTGLLHLAAVTQQRDLMSYLLLNGADANIFDAKGSSVLNNEDVSSKTGRFLLSWGAELFDKGERIASKEMKLGLCDRGGNAAIAKLLSSELGGRRCEVVSARLRGDLVGKTCVAGEYVEESDQYRVTMEFTDESLLLAANKIRRRDRTPRDPGYYVECKNNRLTRRDFKSNEACRAFIASLGSDVEESSEVGPDAEVKAEQAAAGLLAELGLGDLEGPSGGTTRKRNQPAPVGKKKKRGGKKRA